MGTLGHAPGARSGLRFGDLRRGRLDAQPFGRIAKRIKREVGIEVMAHVTCSGSTPTSCASSFASSKRPASRTCWRCAAIRRAGRPRSKRWAASRMRATWSRCSSASSTSASPARAIPKSIPKRRACTPTSKRSSARSTPARASSSRSSSSTTRTTSSSSPAPCPRHHGSDRAGHHADHELRSDRAVHGDVRRDDPGRACAPSSTARRAEPEAVAELGVAYATLQCVELLEKARPASTSTRSTNRRRPGRSSRRSTLRASSAKRRFRDNSSGKTLRPRRRRHPTLRYSV